MMAYNSEVYVKYSKYWLKYEAVIVLRPVTPHPVAAIHEYAFRFRDLGDPLVDEMIDGFVQVALDSGYEPANNGTGWVKVR